MSKTGLNIIAIKNIETIIQYINNLATKHFKPSSTLTRKLETYKHHFSTEEFQNIYLTLYKDNDVYKRADKINITTYKIVDIDPSSIIINLIQCIDVVQGLRDSSLANQSIDPYKEYFFIALIGALEELLSLIDTSTAELLPYSSDYTHLRKTLMAIYSNASKLISLEKKVNQVPEIEFERYIASMKPAEQNLVLQEFLLPMFDVKWIMDMDLDVRRKLFTLMINDIENFKLSPKKAFEVWENYTRTEREEFIKMQRDTLLAKELSMLTED